MRRICVNCEYWVDSNIDGESYCALEKYAHSRWGNDACELFKPKVCEGYAKCDYSNYDADESYELYKQSKGVTKNVY